jgi:hypothetical protein
VFAFFTCIGVFFFGFFLTGILQGVESNTAAISR